jgi:hypothetical protein
MKSTRFLTALAFLFISSITFSQKEGETYEWILLQNENGVKIEYRRGECNLPDQGSYTEQVYLKFTNTTDKLILVDWKYDVTYGDKCFNCDGKNEEMNQSLKLEPGTSKEGACGDNNDLRLSIFSKMLDMKLPDELTEFHVKDVVVRPFRK